MHSHAAVGHVYMYIHTWVLPHIHGHCHTHVHTGLPSHTLADPASLEVRQASIQTCLFLQDLEPSRAESPLGKLRGSSALSPLQTLLGTLAANRTFAAITRTHDAHTYTYLSDPAVS